MSGPMAPSAIRSPGTPASEPASRIAPKASSTSTGLQVVPASSAASGRSGRVETASRSSICTNSPDSGRLDHSALAVT